jgi:hypothetical protein
MPQFCELEPFLKLSLYCMKSFVLFLTIENHKISNEGPRSPQLQEHARSPGYASWHSLGIMGQEWREG